MVVMLGVTGKFVSNVLLIIIQRFEDIKYIDTNNNAKIGDPHQGPLFGAKYS